MRQSTITCRVPAALVERLDRLVPVLLDEEGAATGRAARSTVIRVALVEGVKWLEARHRLAIERARGGGPK